jgi:hypothetical protein
LIDDCDPTPNGDDQGGQDPAEPECCLSCNLARAIAGEEVEPCFTEFLDETGLTLDELAALLDEKDGGDDQGGQDAPIGGACPLSCLALLTLSIIGLRGGRRRR